MSDDYGLQVENGSGDILSGSDFFLGSITRVIKVKGGSKAYIPLQELTGGRLSNFFVIPLNASSLHARVEGNLYAVNNLNNEQDVDVLVVRGLTK